MDMAIAPTAGRLIGPALGGAAEEGFLGVLGGIAGDAVAGLPGAVAGILLTPTPAGPRAEQGPVTGHPDLTYRYQPDELAVTINRTGSPQPVAVLMRDGSGALHDANGKLAGHISPDGAVTLDPGWMQAHGVMAASAEPPVPGAAPGRQTKGPTRQWEKPGGMPEANKDFDAKKPKNVRPLPGGGRVGDLPDGRKIIVRPDSTDGRPTLEIQDGKKRDKVRYGT